MSHFNQPSSTSATSPKVPDHMPVATYREIMAKGSIEWPSSNAKGRGRATSAAKRASPEEDLQRVCFEWIVLQTPRHALLKYLMHVPNGGARSKGEAGKLKAMGTKPGVPDFLLPRGRGHWRGLAIELKSSTGALSPDQKEWLRGLEQEGYLTSVCRTLDNFVALVQAFLNDQVAPSCVERGWGV
jgi:hypothetical protein